MNIRWVLSFSYFSTKNFTNSVPDNITLIVPWLMIHKSFYKNSCRIFKIEIRVTRIFKTVEKMTLVAIEFSGQKMAVEFLNHKIAFFMLDRLIFFQKLVKNVINFVGMTYNNSTYQWSRLLKNLVLEVSEMDATKLLIFDIHDSNPL